MVRRQRAIWLGPPGHRWPVDATYVAWAVGLAAVVVCVGAGLVLGVAVGGTSLWPLGVLGGAVGAWWVTRSVLKVVDHDRPLRYWRQSLAAERRGVRLADRPVAASVALKWRHVELDGP